MPKKMTRSEANGLHEKYLRHCEYVDLKFPGAEFANFLLDHGLIEIDDPPTLLEAAKEIVATAEELRWSIDSKKSIDALRDAIAREEGE